MGLHKDPAFFGTSGYDRRLNDAYYTEPWVTKALIHALPSLNHLTSIWEPACGRGDMVKVLLELGGSPKVLASDFLPLYETAEKKDFFEVTSLPAGVEAIITNPPYDCAEQFLRHALAFKPYYTAMLLRSEFKSAASRSDIFSSPNFVGEVVLTSRPRWDWWETDAPKASPRHNFSWFVWTSAPDRNEKGGRMFFVNKRDVE